MKVVSTEGLTKLIQLIKSGFISVNDVTQPSEIETETPTEITLATVATTGAYSDLTGTPSLSGYQTTANLVTSISSSSTDSQYPSAKCVYDIVGDIETTLNTIRGV